MSDVKIGADGRLPLPMQCRCDSWPKAVVSSCGGCGSVCRRDHAGFYRPGGWLCAGATPNRWGYIALGASLVPNALACGGVARLQPDRQACELCSRRITGLTAFGRRSDAFFPKDALARLSTHGRQSLPIIGLLMAGMAGGHKRWHGCCRPPMGATLMVFPCAGGGLMGALEDRARCAWRPND